MAIVEGGADDVLAASDVVVTASGTATVQAALHGRPMVIVYRLSPLTYTVGRSVVRVSTYGMVNLVAGRTIVPELIQDRFTPEAVAREAVSLLTDRARADAMRRDLAEMRSAPRRSRRVGSGRCRRPRRRIRAAQEPTRRIDYSDALDACARYRRLDRRGVAHRDRFRSSRISGNRRRRGTHRPRPRDGCAADRRSRRRRRIDCHRGRRNRSERRRERVRVVSRAGR